MKNLFYNPSFKKCTCADFIPFYENGKFHLFYLLNHELNPDFEEGISWYKVETSDFVNFSQDKLIIEHGDKQSLDLCVFTGSVIKAFNKYYIFYTGHNIYIKTHGNQNECILRAVSDDLDNFVKDNKFILNAPEKYNKCDFRDPFVYEDNGIFYMLICAKNEELIGESTGETIRMKSTDLNNWEFDKVIYSPKEYQTHECPDMFKIGDYWYLIFSEYSDESLTKYRISKSPEGPWIKPEKDTFDGRAFYAAKTATDGVNRYLFGWVPTRANNLDRENFLWGGNLLVHKIKQNTDGTLSVEIPDSIDELFKNRIMEKNLVLKNATGLESTPLLGSIDGNYIVECDITPKDGTYKFGLRVKHDLETDTSYGIQFDMNKRQLYVKKLPNFPPNEFNEYGLNRSIPAYKTIHVKILNSKDIFVVYLNNELALTFRTCDLTATGVSLFVSNGEIKVDNLIVRKD